MVASPFFSLCRSPRAAGFVITLSLGLLGCTTTVQGGGSGGDGGQPGAGGHGEGGASSASTRPTTGSASPTSGSGCEPTSADGSGPTTTGSMGELGICEQRGGTSGAGAGSPTSCVADFTCPGGDVGVACVTDGGLEVCDCLRDGTTVGQCSNDGYGCVFPENCCYPLLGGGYEPKGEGSGFGACTAEEGGTVSGGSTTGMYPSSCTSFNSCDCGQLTIHCETFGDGTECTCTDTNGFLAAHCTQDALDCDYATNCCRNLVE